MYLINIYLTNCKVRKPAVTSEHQSLSDFPFTNYRMIGMVDYCIGVAVGSLTHLSFIRVQLQISEKTYPDSKVYGANVGPIWGRQDPGGRHVGPMNLAIWVSLECIEMPPNLEIFVSGIYQLFLCMYLSSGYMFSQPTETKTPRNPLMVPFPYYIGIHGTFVSKEFVKFIQTQREQNTLN